MTPLKVLALVPYPLDRVASQRYRVEQLLQPLHEHGVAVDVAPFLTDDEYTALYRPGAAAKLSILTRAVARRTRTVRSARDYDVVLLHREAALFGPAIFETLISARCPVVFDFDDAIWLRSPNPATRLGSLLKFSGKTKRIVARASAVIAGNAFLAAWARQYNNNTHVVPSTLDIDGAYAPVKQHQPLATPIIGWTGSQSTFKYLEQLRPQLAQLAQTHSFKLQVIGAGATRDWPELAVSWLPWVRDREVNDCLAMDIGLAPQPDSEWTRGKCGFKALQYMALGIPVIASNNGVLTKIIEHDRNGLLADTPEQWLRNLQQLLADHALRARLGEAGRRTVCAQFSTALHAPRVADILKQAAHANV